MKKFRMTHRIFTKEMNPPTEFNENDPPSWLISNAYKWWWTDHVMKLKVGEDVKSDFQTIKRIQ